MQRQLGKSVERETHTTGDTWMNRLVGLRGKADERTCSRQEDSGCFLCWIIYSTAGGESEPDKVNLLFQQFSLNCTDMRSG